MIDEYAFKISYLDSYEKVGNGRFKKLVEKELEKLENTEENKEKIEELTLILSWIKQVDEEVESSIEYNAKKTEKKQPVYSDISAADMARIYSLDVYNKILEEANKE